MQNHPLFTHHWGSRAEYVPLRVHGDEAAFTRSGSLLILCWSSFLAHRETPIWHGKFLCCAMPKGCVPENTRMAVYQTLKWSFEALFQGLYPSLDHQGGPFPVGSQRRLLGGTPLPKKAVVYRLVGDLEWFAVALGLESYHGLEMCFRCDCNRSDRPWTDFEAPWRLRSPALPDHPFFGFPGLSRHCISLDSLHIVDLGLSGVIVGGIIHSLYMERPAAQRPAFVSHLWQLIQEAYRACQSKYRLDRFQPGMWLPSSAQDFPGWKGRGADPRVFSPPVPGFY